MSKDVRTAVGAHDGADTTLCCDTGGDGGLTDPVSSLCLLTPAWKSHIECSVAAHQHNTKQFLAEDRLGLGLRYDARVGPNAEAGLGDTYSWRAQTL